MRRVAFIALVGVGFLIAATPEERFNSIIDRYSAVTTLKASFNQQVCSKADGTCQMLRGSFLYASPDNFRLEVSLPQEQLVVYNGEKTWIYLPTANQAIQLNPGPEQEIFLFLGQLKDYSKTYTVNLSQTETWLQARFTAKPDVQAFLKEFVLLIDSAVNDIAGIKIENSATEITFLLEDLVHGVKTTPEQFTFTPPEGVTVIKDIGSGYE
ncbi:outer membrane lipoprotein carrier protein LolA [candidate division WOR-3 bacterium]|nr:outer membrane lipoprotein carrier protein LolA [candidate division WOR-3 bacterium]